MNNILKIKFSRRHPLTTLLGLALDGSRLEGVVLRRANGSLQVQQSFSVTLSLDPLTAAPELVGREIRNHLDAAGVRERRCVVGVPLKWVLTTHTELPPLPDADAASLLQLESERGFPCDVATLRQAHSRCQLPADKQFVTLAGIPNNQLAALEQVLAAAKLKPLSFSSGVTALQPPKAAGGVLALAIGENQVSLQITAGGGVAALRSLKGAVENEGARRTLQAELVAREVRITLGQLPAALRESVRRIRVFGPRDLAQPLADAMELRLEPMGLQVELVAAYAPDEFGVELPPNLQISAAFSLAARGLTGQAPVFEFLPPKPTAWQQLAARYSSSRLRTAGAVAAGIFVLVAGLFLFQEIQLIVLRSQWSRLSARVKNLENVQQQIRKYRPWFDDSFRDLSVLRQLTLAFPEDGTVTAKSVEIRDGNIVNCSGIASDNAALLRTLSQLRAADGVSSLKVDQIRGKAPMQFTFDFHWNQGGGSEN
ncbi:MAG TPA: hypothetical protein VMB80_10675 [Candidatus Acidoferrum sp.]|nr:hypothetical protein [Candidatus Acidoferrum sp.]